MGFDQSKALAYHNRKRMRHSQRPCAFLFSPHLFSPHRFSPHRFFSSLLSSSLLSSPLLSSPLLLSPLLFSPHHFSSLLISSPLPFPLLPPLRRCAPFHALNSVPKLPAGHNLSRRRRGRRRSRAVLCQCRLDGLAGIDHRDVISQHGHFRDRRQLSRRDGRSESRG